MKRYITSRESTSMTVSTMAGNGKKIVLFDILVFLEAHERKFRGTLAHNIVNIVYYFYVNFLHLRVTQKALQLPFLLFLFFLPVTDFTYISSFVTQDGVTRNRLLSLDALANVFVKATIIVKFRMCEYDIPRALEKIAIADLSALVTWSFKVMWQAKTISSPLAQCLRPRELLRW